MTIQYSLLASHNSKRVRLSTTSPSNISVVVGSALQTWPVGCFIEVLNVNATGTMSLLPSPGVVINAFNGLTIPTGGYARVSLVAAGQWDAHVYFPGTNEAPPPLAVLNATGATVLTDTTQLRFNSGFSLRQTGPTGIEVRASAVTEEIVFSS